MKKLTEINRRKMEAIALEQAERNLGSGLWKLETAQLFLKTVAEQPEDHMYLLNHYRSAGRAY